jgi:uncharacterized protein (DUF433 family)
MTERTMTETAERPARDRLLNIDEQTADALIARYIEQDPNHPGRHEAWIVTDDPSPPVWYIVAYLQGDYDVAQFADDYGLPDEALTAAIAYYQRHRDLLDAKHLLEYESRRASDASFT